MSILTVPVEDESAWGSAELAADASWQFFIGGPENDELETVFRSRDRVDGSVGAGGAGHWLPTFLIDHLMAIRYEVIWGRGVSLLRGLDVSRYSEDELRHLFRSIGEVLGVGVSQNAKGDLVGDIRDVGLRFGGERVRGYQTNAALPFHTDGPDIVGLLCIQTGHSGGDSMIASAMTVYNELLGEYRSAVGLLYKDYPLFLKGEEPRGDSPVSASPIYSFYDGYLSCRFVSGLVEQGAEVSGIPLSTVDRSVLELMQTIPAGPQNCYEMSLIPGDIQFLNNSTVLHARSAFDDPGSPGAGRHFLRLWINVTDGRPADPNLFSFYRNGVPPRVQ